MSTKKKIAVKINGKVYRRNVEVRQNLADFLRDDLDLTGTHIGCEHGACGACTVLFNDQSVRSCLMFAVQADGAEIRTVEGLNEGNQLHPLQESFWECHALQCGYCTPGLLLTLVSFLRDHPDPSEEEIRKAISGNLCRCTGYQNIVLAVMKFVQKNKGKWETVTSERLKKRGRKTSGFSQAMVPLAVLRSPLAHVKILNVNVEKARKC
jgi:aerobic carbon-monoxide dehydrogenase small subunit